MNEFDPKPYWRMGSRDYMAGVTENPFEPETEQYRAWQEGFDEEKKYWEAA